VSLFAGQDRAAMRAAWRTAWQRHLERLPLAPLQVQMADVMAAHPEYHAQLGERQGPEAEVADASEASGRAFLHLALHLALREQLATDRPHGIAQLHRQLTALGRAGHEAEHRMMSVLEQTLWEAQRAGKMPDEARYLEALRRL
jgi:hypothetical protein